jgi:hypothetical protein
VASEILLPGGASRTTAPAHSAKAQSVLVVEDPLVCKLIGGILQRVGYHVTEAELRCGIGHLRNQVERFSLLITNSPAAFLEFAEAVPVIYVAAIPDPEIARRFRRCAMLSKPFLPSRLVELAREMAGAL